MASSFLALQQNGEAPDLTLLHRPWTTMDPFCAVLYSPRFLEG